jgi:hypothetical protein
MPDPLIIAGREFGSRLFLGTAGYPNRMLMLDAIAASGTEMVTASIRRISLSGEDESLVDLIPKHIRFLPNTAGKFATRPRGRRGCGEAGDVVEFSNDRSRDAGPHRRRCARLFTDPTGPPMQVSEEALAKARAVDDIRASFLQGDAEPDFQRRVIEHAMHVLVAEHRIETISQARVEAVLENVLDYRP